MVCAKPLEILMVEDNRGDVILAKTAFKANKSNCNISVASNGVEGLDYLENLQNKANAEKTDLILVDINMPCMDGKEFLKVVKSDDRFRHIPVIMFSSSDAQSDIDDCYRAHANSYVIKPCGVHAMKQVAQGIVDFWFRISERVQPTSMH